tara:strand:- start:811 stop:1068 length:258 start_codon:yes stop_codon:yes gene_type:complete
MEWTKRCLLPVKKLTSSKKFCNQVFDIFGESIVKAHSNFFKDKDELYKLSVAEPDSKSDSNRQYHGADLSPHAVVMYNTPVKKKS